MSAVTKKKISDLTKIRCLSILLLLPQWNVSPSADGVQLLRKVITVPTETFFHWLELTVLTRMLGVQTVNFTSYGVSYIGQNPVKLMASEQLRIITHTNNFIGRY